MTGLIGAIVTVEVRAGVLPGEVKVIGPVTAPLGIGTINRRPSILTWVAPITPETAVKSTVVPGTNPLAIIVIEDPMEDEEGSTRKGVMTVGLGGGGETTGPVTGEVVTDPLER